MVFNLKNTISQFKRFIGKKFNDPSVQQDIHDVPYQIVQMPDDNIGIKVHRIIQVLNSIICVTLSCSKLRFLPLTGVFQSHSYVLKSQLNFALTSL